MTQLKVFENLSRFENRHCEDSVTNKDKVNVNCKSDSHKNEIHWQIATSRNKHSHSTNTEKKMVLTKMRNNLKRPTTKKKWPETTYNNLKSPIMNKKQPGNHIQWARHDLKQPTTSKTQPTTTQTYLQQAKKRCKTTNNKQILRLFYNMEQSVLF